VSRAYQTGKHTEVDSAVATDYPLTFACWFKADATDQEHNLLFLGDKDQANYWNGLQAGDAGESNFIRAMSHDHGGASFTDAQSSAAYSTNVWFHAAGTWTDESNRAAFKDGANKGTDTTTVGNAANWDRTSIGRLGDSSASDQCEGDIAEAAIWNVVLTDAEIAWLAKGYSPLTLWHRFGNLIMYQNLIRDINRPGVGPTLTDTNSSAVPHAPIIYPSVPHRFTGSIVASGAAEFMVSVNQLSESGGVVGTVF